MNIEDLSESEYDKVGDFYFGWLQKYCPDRDVRISSDIEIMLSMLGNVEDRCICDLACGEGYLSRILAARGARVTGVDISRILLDHARRHPQQKNISYILDDAQSLSLIPATSMDAVVCHMALMDIPDLSATCASVRRILVDGGTFVFCILHPCFETPFNAQNPPEECDEDGNFKAARISRYSLEGKWYSDGMGMRGTLGSHHRMLSTYFNTLFANGFRLTELSEPIVPANPVSTVQRRENIVPTVLIAKSNALPG
jgi:SAM-dependent methyltransferase